MALNRMFAFFLVIQLALNFNLECVSTPCQLREQDRIEGKESWLIYGLSANPVHLGHINFCEQVVKVLKPDRVIIVPARVNPLKSLKDQCTAEQKLNMIQMACQAHPEWEIDQQELRRDPPSYTWMTIQNLVEEAKGKASLYLLITDETAADFHLWNDPIRADGKVDQDYIISNAHLVIGERPGQKLDKVYFMERFKMIDQLARNHVTTDTTIHLKNSQGEEIPTTFLGKNNRQISEMCMNTLESAFLGVKGEIEISSTDIRKLCQSNLLEKELIEKLTPYVGQAVAEVIATEKLFQTK